MLGAIICFAVYLPRWRKKHQDICLLRNKTNIATLHFYETKQISGTFVRKALKTQYSGYCCQHGEMELSYYYGTKNESYLLQRCKRIEYVCGAPMASYGHAKRQDDYFTDNREKEAVRAN